jgi:hypothetical protein
MSDGSPSARRSTGAPRSRGTLDLTYADHGEGHVLGRRQVLEQVEALEDHAYPLPGVNSAGPVQALTVLAARTRTRSLISNIHDDGIPPAQAAEEAVALIEQLRASGASGVSAVLSGYQRRRLTRP